MASRILLADDSITIQKVVNLTFADEGIEVVSVSNGDQAERRLPEVDPDLVLADIFMPGKNGYELCESIKTDPQFTGMPVVLLVGAFEPFNEAEARRVKADGHLTKPFESRVLVDMVRNLIVNHPRKRATTAPQPTTQVQSPIATQPLSPILRPESNLDFAAMNEQNQPVFEFATPNPVDESAAASPSNHNQLKPAMPRAGENQSGWSFSNEPNEIIDFEKVDATQSRTDGSVVAFEVDAVPPLEPADVSISSSQQAFIAILTEPSAQEAEEGGEKKFDTSELEGAGKKFDTNELEEPSPVTADAAAQPSVAQPAAPIAEPEAGFGFAGEFEEEPLGDVLTGAVPLSNYTASEEHSPLEIEEPVIAKPSVYDEAQIAGSPLRVDAFIDVTAPSAATAPPFDAASETAKAFDSTSAEAHPAQDTGVAPVAENAPVEATVQTAELGSAAESSQAVMESQFSESDMWSIGLPTKAPGPDYAPVPPSGEPAAPGEAKPGETQAALPLEASQQTIDEIVRRVVAQLSDTVVREIAWEIVPECVERVVTNLTKEKVAEDK